MSIPATHTAPERAAQLQSPIESHDAELRSIGFVSTFPPTKCGLATFTASLARVLARTCRVGVVRCVDEPGVTPGAPEVVAEWVRGSDRSVETAAHVLRDYDAVIVQHEFGVYGGADGADVLELVARLAPP